ncbi:hypothetical protein SDC9_172294 [bioreactor metagenome]|uniref:Uncharacterized protein n=1 Tax=bioreactor metagenome TaxID=1076179 RepID=A0A645GGH6_9ZZZZ
MLVRLYADHVDGHTRVKAPLDQMLIVRGGVEIVQRQDRARRGFLHLMKYHPGQLHLPQLPAQAGDGVIVAVKYRHDHHFVDHIPHVDQAFERFRFPADAGQLFRKDRLIVILQQPGGADRMPAKRMPFERDPLASQIARGSQQPFSLRQSLLRLKPSPVKGQGRVVEYASEELKPFAQKFLLAFTACRVKHLNGVSHADTKQEPVLFQLQAAHCIFDRAAVGTLQRHKGSA